MTTTSDKQSKSIADFLVNGLASKKPVLETAEEAGIPLHDTGSTEPIKPTGPTKNTKATAPLKLKPGRPRSVATERVHVALTPDMYSYLEEAWRTHRTISGNRVKGPSAFIEDLLARHSQQNRE